MPHHGEGVGGGPAQSIMPFSGGGSVIAAGAIRWLMEDTHAGLEWRTGRIIPVDCIVDRLWITVDGPVGAGEAIVFTVRINGVNTLVTATIAGAVQVVNSDLLNQQAFVSGDEITVMVVSTNNGGYVPQNVHCSLRVTVG